MIQILQTEKSLRFRFYKWGASCSLFVWPESAAARCAGCKKGLWPGMDSVENGAIRKESVLCVYGTDRNGIKIWGTKLPYREKSLQEPGSVVENPVTLGFHLKGTDNMPHL